MTSPFVEPVLAAVRARRPVDEREAASIERFVDEVGRLTDPFSEDADPVHITASAIVVGTAGLVLHRHKRLGIWLQPGGHVDVGEAPWDASIRETLEETGLPAEHMTGSPVLVHVDVHPGPRGHTHLDLRYLLVVADDRAPDPGEGESRDVAWFGWADARAMADPALTGIIDALAPDDPDRIEVRRAVAADDGWGLGALYVRSHRHAYPSFAAVHTPEQTIAWVSGELLRSTETWVAAVAGVPVGLLSLGAGTVEQLYVEPAWIGRGVGRRLLLHALALAPAGLELWTYAANERAIAFYERHGFSIVERTDGSHNEQRQPDVRMRRPPVRI